MKRLIIFLTMLIQAWIYVYRVTNNPDLNIFTRRSNWNTVDVANSIELWVFAIFFKGYIFSF